MAVAPALDDPGFSEQRLDGPSILFLAGGTELVVHVLSPAAGFAGHLLRHMTDKYHEAVDARCQQAGMAMYCHHTAITSSGCFLRKLPCPACAKRHLAG